MRECMPPFPHKSSWHGAYLKGISSWRVTWISRRKFCLLVLFLNLNISAIYKFRNDQNNALRSEIMFS
jgi:hypothetical protein